MNDEKPMAERVADALSDEVPADVAARLRAAREQAVAAVDERHRPSPWLTWVPAGGAVAAAVLVTVMLNEQGIEPLPALDAQELEAASDMELLDELPMLAWLAEQDSDAG